MIAKRRRATPPSIFVVGPEGSGTTAVWRCVVAHPALRGRTTAQAPTPGEHPKRFGGGELRLYDTVVRGARAERSNSYVSIDPADNTAVFFASDIFHEVCPVRPQSAAFSDSRFSINVWFWLGETPQCLARPLDGPVTAKPAQA